MANEAPGPRSSRLRDLPACLAFRALRRLLGFVPPGGVVALAGGIGSLGHLADRRHRRIALDNVARALPELAPSRRRDVVRSSFRNLAQTLLDTLASSATPRDELRERFAVEGWEHLEAAEADGKGVLLMTAHFGNWEAAGQLLALENRPLTALARPIANTMLHRDTCAVRERFGNRTVPKRSGMRQIFAALRDGGRVALLIDQRVHPNEGKAYRFFGRPAYTSPLLASLSCRTGAPVVPFYGLPLDGGRRYLVVIRPPIRPGDPLGPGEEELDPVDRLTLRYLEALESEIRARPELWLWMHRRWRKNPTRFPKKRIPKTAAGPESDEIVERPRTAGGG